jgi:Tol biopolymer transport system component
MAVPFDLQDLEVKGSAVPVVDGVRGLAGPFGAFAVSESGTLAYVPGEPGLGLSTLVWVDRQGAEKRLSAPPRPYRNPRLSPEGNRVAIDIGESTDQTQRADIWVYDLVRGTLSRITSANRNGLPVWSPDGKRLYYASGDDQSHMTIISAPADGTSPPPAHPISETGPRRFPDSVSSDGKLLLGRNIGSGTGNDFWVLPLTGGVAAFRPFLDARFRRSAARFSPDGHWVAYVSSETGGNQIYVTEYPGPGGTHPVSTDGGAAPRWAADGRELFFANGAKITAVDVQTSPTFHVGIPKVLFERRDLLTSVFDVSPDGKRFLMLKPEAAPQSQASQLNIVVNWHVELRRLAPASGK